VVGHSLGEYAALYAAGVLTASDTILIVGSRALLVEKHCTPGTHTMLAVRAPPKTITDLTAGIALDIACINGPDDVVLGGTVEAIDAAAKTLGSSNGIKLTRLPVPYAYHSSQLDPVTAPFEHAARGVEFHTPAIPVLSPLLGRDITSGGVVSAPYLARHLREKVDFPLALSGSAFLSESPPDTTQFLELGPHPVCSGMIASVLGVPTIPSLCRGENAWKAALASLGALHLRGFDVDWEEHNRDMGASVSCLAGLPGYAFEEKDYWIEYRGDWALSKGDAKASSGAVEVVVPRGPATASVQRLVFERLDEQPVSAEFESDLRRPDICKAITGHVVDGVALCPSVSVHGRCASALVICERLTLMQGRFRRHGIHGCQVCV
jgi:acyl transferase domain-containing protein